MIGQIIGNYKIEQKLGEGGMGAVYKGVDTMLDREVAIKALRPELASQIHVVERFRSEAVTLAKLNHPNIATLYSLFRQSDELYMVLEFVRGETLDNILARRGALAADEAIPVFAQVMDGINHAHELGIVHRDIKPANMMLTEKGTLKVLDFGIARLLGSARTTRHGNIIGTLEYMAPEQVRGLETDCRTDIYALGMMLYEVLTGRLAFQTENEFELMKLQTEATPVQPVQINPNIPHEVNAAIMRAIEKDPNHRFQTAGDFRETLLAAGFSAKGILHSATTGNRQALSPNSNPNPNSQPAISNPAIAPAKALSAPIAANKETRIGAPTNVGKETRIGASVAHANAANFADQNQAANQAANQATNNASSGFFSRLTAVHYISAGAAALVLLGALAIVPAALLLSGKSRKVEAVAAPVAEPAKDERPEIVELPKSDQPIALTPPTAQPAENQAATNVPANTTAQKPAAPINSGDLTPIAARPTEAPKRQIEKPKPAATKQPPPKQQKQKSGAGKSAECLLTGDC